MTDDSTDAMAERIASSIREQTADDGDSRRRFLSKSAVAGVGLLALGGGAGAVLAQEDDDEMDAEDLTASFDDVAGTDVDVLNYALSLEHLENAFYAEALENYSEDDFANAAALESFPEEQRRDAYGVLETIGAHEAAHVDVLTQAVELLGGEASMEASYDFGIESVEDVLALGRVFENTGVAAYAGAGTFIESPDLQSAALSIHSVESRHAAYLNHLNGMPPAPNAFDPAASQEEVLTAVSDFIVESENGEETPTATPGNETTPTPTATPGNETTPTPTSTPEDDT